MTSRTDAYFLDANVLMYTVGAEHPLREPCRCALRRAVELRVPLITDAEVLQEILYRYFAVARPDTAREIYRHTVDLCEEVLPVTEPDTARALELLDAHNTLTPRDAIHVATMEAAGLTHLLSADRDFDVLGSIQRIDPVDFASAPGPAGGQNNSDSGDDDADR